MTEQMHKKYPKPLSDYRALLPAAERYTYMNSGGCGPLPIPVVRKMEDIFDRMMEQGQVNVEIHDWLKDVLEDVRKEVADFINASPEEIFFVRCIAEGLNTISRMFTWEEGDEVLISDQENPASILPFFAIEPIFHTKTQYFHGIGNKEQLIEQFTQKLNEHTKMCVVSHVFHTTGCAIPAEEMCHEAEARGMITVLDGAQAAGNIPIDVKKLGCSFYLLSCHKWLCGLEGVAAVYIRKDLLTKVRVPFGGVGMQQSFDFETHAIQMQPDAHRFEYGGRHTPMYVAFAETIRFAREIGTERIYQRIHELHLYCREQFERRLPQVEILSPSDERLITGIFAFRVPGIDHRELVKLAWKEWDIIIQWRTVNLFTKEEGIRVSLNWFIQEEEIDRLITAMEALIRRLL